MIDLSILLEVTEGFGYIFIGYQDKIDPRKALEKLGNAMRSVTIKRGESKYVVSPLLFEVEVDGKDKVNMKSLDQITLDFVNKNCLPEYTTNITYFQKTIAQLRSEESPLIDKTNHICYIPIFLLRTADTILLAHTEPKCLEFVLCPEGKALRGSSPDLYSRRLGEYRLEDVV